MSQTGEKRYNLCGGPEHMARENQNLAISSAMRVQFGCHRRRQWHHRTHVQLPRPRLSRSQIMPHVLSRLSLRTQVRNWWASNPCRREVVLYLLHPAISIAVGHLCVGSGWFWLYQWWGKGCSGEHATVAIQRGWERLCRWHSSDWICLRSKAVNEEKAYIVIISTCKKAKTTRWVWFRFWRGRWRCSWA